MAFFFYGTHLTKLDSKGRLLVPPSFRAKLRSLRSHDDGSTEVAMILRQADDLPCIEVWAPEPFEALLSEVSGLGRFSPARSTLATTLFAGAYEVVSDREGRISVPGKMLAYAAVSGPAAFMGIGDIFQIWHPDGAEQRLAFTTSTVSADRARREERERLAQGDAA